MAKGNRLTISFLFLAFFAAFANLSLSTPALAAGPAINALILRDPDSGSTAYLNNNYAAVVLSVSYSAPPTQMIFSEYNDFHDAAWISYANPTTYTFASIYNGPRTVYCKLRNASLEESNTAQDTILMDVCPPSVSAAYSQVVDNTHIDIAFTEAMNNIATPAYFTINNGVNVLSVQYQGGPYFKYRLTTNPQQIGLSYTVTVSASAKDLAGNSIDPNARTYSYIAIGSGGDTTPPVADAGPDKSANVGVQVSFDGSASTDNVGVTRYVWNFGDGSSTEEGVAATHIYTSAGVYTVTLTVYDAAGNSDPDTAQVTISAPPSGTYLEVGGPSPDYNTITDAMANIAEGGTIYVYAGVYPEIVHLKNNVTLKGDNNETVIIKGEVIAEEVSGTIENLSIEYREGTMLSFTNSNYIDLKLMADAGITVINPLPTFAIKKCIIKPDLEYINYEGGYDPPLLYYGKAVQVWNMYGTEATTDTTPLIEGNLIIDTDCGIYYFSQAFGGALLGKIKNNTFYHNKDGIILRMHKENPRIYNNIFDHSLDSAIFFTYEDTSLFDQRKQNINNNLFNQNNGKNLYTDSTGAIESLIGWKFNIEGDPLFIDPDNGDFHVQTGSPCLEAGEGGENIGAYGETVSELFIQITSPQNGITIDLEP